MNQQPEDLNEFDIFKLWKVFTEYAVLIAAITIVATLLSAYYVLNLPVVYKTKVLIIPSNESQQSQPMALNSLASLAGLSSSQKGSIGIEGERLLVRLKTRSFLINFIEKEKIKPILFHKQWNKIEKQWKEKEPSNYQAYKALKKIIYIERKREENRAGLVGIVIKSNDLNKIAYIANNLVRSMNSLQKKLAISEAEESINFLKKELGKTDIIESRNILYTLIANHMTTITLANVRKQFVFSIIDPAVTPRTAEANNSTLIITLTMLLASLFSFLLVVIFESVKRKNYKN